MKLRSEKQKMFVKEYLIDLNATQAAIRSGYSPKTAYRTGCDNLTKPQIQAAIQKTMNARAEKVGLTAEKVLSDIMLIKADAMTSGERGMIDRPSALKACEMEGKHLKMFTDKIEHTGKDGKPIELIKADMDPKEAAKIYTQLLKGE